MNIVVLRGTLSRPAEARTLPSGDTLVTYEVTTRRAADAKADTVPVVSFGIEPASLPDTGREVVVLGLARRRFFRVGGSTQSRTEVVAERVVPASDRRKVQRLLSAARDALTL